MNHAGVYSSVLAYLRAAGRRACPQRRSVGCGRDARMEAAPIDDPLFGPVDDPQGWPGGPRHVPVPGQGAGARAGGGGTTTSSWPPSRRSGVPALGRGRLPPDWSVTRPYKEPAMSAANVIDVQEFINSHKLSPTQIFCSSCCAS